jgi:Xaa-Pro aminopeptidase
MLERQRFQSFEDQSSPAQAAPRLAALRAELARRKLDGFLVPRSDEHNNEYVPKRAERLAWLTGFTGSAGMAIVLKDRAILFVDGRYTVQGREQTDPALFEIVHLIENPPPDWLATNLKPGQRIGFDPWLHTQDAKERFAAALKLADAELVPCTDNPLDAVWPDQPPPPVATVQVFDETRSGEASARKRARIAEDLKRSHADAAVLTLPESICWLFNVRGGDLPHTPFALSFAILHDSGEAEWFIDERKLTPEVRRHIGNAVHVRAPAQLGGALEGLSGKKVIADPGTAAAAIFDRLKAGNADIARQPDPCLLPKACKNAVEVEGMRQAHIRDGAALTRFLAWIAAEAPKGGLTEIDAAKKLEDIRVENGALKDLSFDSISGAGAHAALPHYRVTQKSNRQLKRNEIFLIDSGGQYEDGTTDVTRTVVVGKPNAEMKERFTLVLKGHIALGTARFPEGTTGAQLDTLARYPLWQYGLDFDHGTGHGVGHYLSVHEGPQSISKRPIATALRPGMICSNEPGFYKTGDYGIRIENLIVVKEPEEVPGGERKMLSFETITLAPIDLELVEPSLLTKEEKDWLNAYHKRVHDTISPKVDALTRTWLQYATRPI